MFNPDTAGAECRCRFYTNNRSYHQFGKDLEPAVESKSLPAARANKIPQHGRVDVGCGIECCCTAFVTKTVKESPTWSIQWSGWPPAERWRIRRTRRCTWHTGDQRSLAVNRDRNIYNSLCYWKMKETATAEADLTADGFRVWEKQLVVSEGKVLRHRFQILKTYRSSGHRMQCRVVFVCCSFSLVLFFVSLKGEMCGLYQALLIPNLWIFLIFFKKDF